VSKPPSDPAKKKLRKKRAKKPPQLIGSRALVDFPLFGVEGVPAKVDTGARTSSLHATHIRQFERDGEPWVAFRFYSGTRGSRKPHTAEAPLSAVRKIRSSNGATEERLIIRTKLRVQDRVWSSEVSLAKRGSMAFPMLLGRTCLRKRFLVDCSKLYVVPSEA